MIVLLGDMGLGSPGSAGINHPSCRRSCGRKGSGHRGPEKRRTLNNYLAHDWIALLWTKRKYRNGIQGGAGLQGPLGQSGESIYSTFIVSVCSMVYFKTVLLVQGRVLQPLACLGFRSSSDAPQPLEMLAEPSLTVHREVGFRPWVWPLLHPPSVPLFLCLFVFSLDIRFYLMVSCLSPGRL